MLNPERYTILEEIASGSTATVYLAQDNVLRRKVALKKLHPHLHNHADMVKRFAKEAVAIAALSHENIIKVFEYGNQERNLFLAMEYIDGVNLDTLLKGEAVTLPNLASLSLFQQLLQGLASAHDRGIYHRDIKPSNVLLDKKGCVRIADFGIAFLSGETSITRTGSFLGTPGYSAPEQADGREATDRTDIFSMGILFYRCLAGRLPFEGDTPHSVLRAIMERTPAKPTSLNRKILPGLPELIESMLAKDPQARPNARECLAELEALARGLGFLFEPRRLAAFLADAAIYREKEEREISDHFLDHARLVRGHAKPREALKGYALAETFCAEPEKIRLEAEDLLKKLRLRFRKKILVGGLACLAVLAGVAGQWGHRTQAPITIFPVTPELPNQSFAPSRSLPTADLSPATVGTVSQFKFAANQPGRSFNPERKPGYRKPDSQPRPIQPGPDLEHAAVENNPQVGNPGGPEGTKVGKPSSQGYLIVKSNPPFAKLFVEGKEAGTTPTKSPIQMEDGVHELILVREGCRPLHSTFKIVPSETTSLRLILEKSESEPDRP